MAQAAGRVWRQALQPAWSHSKHLRGSLQIGCGSPAQDRQATSTSEKQFQIRVKSINFLDKPSTAVYFFELTSAVQTIQLTQKLLKQEKQRNAICMLSPERLQTEVCTPLSSVLMILQSLL